MKRAKHTKGPWVIKRYTNSNVHFVVPEQGGEVLLETPDVNLERMANMRLIAAAPEMLEALELALKTLREIECKLGHFDPEATLEIEQAIAKAKGE